MNFYEGRYSKTDAKQLHYDTVLHTRWALERVACEASFCLVALAAAPHGRGLLQQKEASQAAIRTAKIKKVKNIKTKEESSQGENR